METVAHILGIIALAFAVISYQQKTHKSILVFQLLANMTFCVHFIMLGAVTGGILNAVAATRAVIFVNKGKRWAENKIWLWVFCAVSIIVGILTWKDLFSILPILGMLCTTAALWIKTPKYVRLVAFPSSPLWLVYNTVNKSYAGAITEIITMCSIIIAIIRLDLNKNTKITESERIKQK